MIFKFGIINLIIIGKQFKLFATAHETGQIYQHGPKLMPHKAPAQPSQIISPVIMQIYTYCKLLIQQKTGPPMHRSRSHNLFADLYPLASPQNSEDPQILEINQFYSNLFQNQYADTGLSAGVRKRMSGYSESCFEEPVRVSDFSHKIGGTREVVLNVSPVELETCNKRSQQGCITPEISRKQARFARIKSLLHDQRGQGDQIRQHKSFHALQLLRHPEQSTQESDFREEQANNTCFQVASVKSKLRSLQNNVRVLRKQNKQYGRKIKEYESNLSKLQWEVQYLRQDQKLMSQSRSPQNSAFADQKFVEELQQALNQQSESTINIAMERDQLLNQLNETLHHHDQQVSELRDKLDKAVSEAEKIRQQQKSYNEEIQKLTRIVEYLKKQRQNLQQRNQVLEQQLFQEKHSLEKLKDITVRLQQENALLNEESIQLAQNLQSMREEYEHSKNQGSQFEQIIKQKQQQIEELKQRNDQISLQLQHIQDEAQFLRKIVSSDESTMKEQSTTIFKSNEQILQLSKQLEYYKSGANLLCFQKMKELLRLPQSSNQQQILACIKSTVEHERRMQHHLQGYFQIAQLFGVQPRNPSCQDRLISEVCRYKNSMSALLRKLSFSQNRLQVLSQQNQHLANCLENNQQLHLSHSENLQNLIQLQNQQLVRNKAQQMSERLKKKYLYY